MAIRYFPLRSSGPHITPLRSTVNGKRARCAVNPLTNVQLRCIAAEVGEKSPVSPMRKLSASSDTHLDQFDDGARLSGAREWGKVGTLQNRHPFETLTIRR